MYKDFELQKMPYLYSSSNLFEQFLIIGYSEEERKKTILQIVKDSLATEEVNNPLFKEDFNGLSINHTLEPSIISSISTNNISASLDSSTLLKIIFPIPPKFIYLSNITKQKDEISGYTVIFFINCDTIDKNNQKQLCYGFCDIFYEAYRLAGNEQYYIPKGFCFISKYPYFSHFKTLSKELLKNFSANQIPIEILLYNIINNSPRTIAEKMTLSWFPENYYGNNSYSVKKAMFGGLPGYPIIDLNFAEIFAILPMELIIQVFVYNFLEIDMLFFSKNIEMLNLFMYLFSVLNYPLTDSMYLWHIISISKKELLNGDGTSLFVGKPNSSMLGVNCEYDESIRTESFSDCHFVIDLDTQIANLMSSNGEVAKKENESIIKFKEYFESLLHLEEKPKSSFEQNVYRLIKEIEGISTKVIINNKRCSQFVPNFFETNDSIINKNKQVQEIFYAFIINALKPIYSSCHNKENIASLLSFNKKSDILDSINIRDESLSKEEMLFYDLFSDTNKYSAFIASFLYSYTAIDCYKIPYIFLEQFLQLNNSIDEEYSFKHFEIMDDFFYNSETLSFSVCNYDSLIKKKMAKALYFEGNKLLQYSQAKKNSYTLSKVPKFELDQGMIYNYLNIINSMDDSQLLKCFPSKDFKTQTILYEDISQHILSSLRKYKLLTTYHLLSFSSILFGLTSLNAMTIGEFWQYFRTVIELIKKVNNSTRKFITLLLFVYYYQAVRLKSTNENYDHLLIAFHALLVLITNWRIYPDIELMKLITLFNIIDPHEMDYKKQIINEDLQIEDIIKEFPLQESICSSSIANRKLSIYTSVTAAESPNKKMNKFIDSNTTSISPDQSLCKSVMPSTANNSPSYSLNYRIYLTKNMCKDGGKREELILQKAFNPHFDSDLVFKCSQCNLDIFPKLKMIMNINKKQSEFLTEIYSPLKIYNNCLYLFNTWKSHEMDNDALEREQCQKLMINLLFYQVKLDLHNLIPLVINLFK